MLKNCLVLSLRDFGENSLLVTVLHPQLGKQMFLAKGGKRIGAKLTPHLQPLHLINLWLAPAKGEIATIREVKVVRSYLPPPYLSLKFSLRVSELIEKTTNPYLECKEFMRQSLHILGIVRARILLLADLKKLWIQFELILLDYLGIKPDLRTIQSKPINTLARFLERRIHQILLS